MQTAISKKVGSIHTRIRAMLVDTRLALSGERQFGVEQVRALSSAIQEAAPVIARAAESRAGEPELAGELELYKAALRELQTALDHIHLMLLTQRAQMETRRGQLEAVSQWAGTLQQTR
jgi:hypothetical protein